MNEDFPGDPCERKPDLEGRDVAARQDAKTHGEGKTSLADISGSQRKGWQNSKIIFCAQQNRRFIIGCVGASDTIGLYRIDRTGMLSSGLYEVHKFPEYLAWTVVGLTLVDQKHLGYDPTLMVMNGVSEVTLKSTVYKVLGNIFADGNMFRRGTTCFFKVEHPMKYTTCVLKDAWIDVKSAEKETDILKKLYELGITNIPTYLDSKVVELDGRDDFTQDTRLAVEDSDSVARPFKFLSKRSSIVKGEAITHDDEQAAQNEKIKEIKEKGRGKVKRGKAAKGNRVNVSPAIRDHYRIIVDPYEIGFAQFRCLEEFLLAIKDIVSVIKQLYEHRVLHRDVSINNIVLAERDADVFQKTYRRFQGYLIDYDRAIFMDREGSEARAEVTGTVPFMAIDALMNLSNGKNSFVHDYYHDLESLFYVVCWVCTFYCGPNGKLRREREYETSNVASWKVHDFSDEALKKAIRSKLSFTGAMENFRREISEDFHPYFAPIFDCMCVLRCCLFPAEMDKHTREFFMASMKALEGRTDPEGVRKFRSINLYFLHHERDHKIVFDEIFAVIDDARAKLPDEHRLKHSYPPPPPDEERSDDEDESDESDDSDDDSDDGSVFWNKDKSLFMNAPPCMSVITSGSGGGKDGEETHYVAIPIQTFLRARNLAGSTSSSSSSMKRKSIEEPTKDPRPRKVVSR